MKRILPLALAIALIAASSAQATDYFVDSYRGDDSAAGTSPETAWRTLDRVNGAEYQPGDAVRFLRGGIWRGSLECRSGAENAPVVYTDYGSDPNPPRIMPSVDLSDPKNWSRVGDSDVWVTPGVEWRDLGATTDDVKTFAQTGWHVYTEEDARAECSEAEFEELGGAKGYKVRCEASGSEKSFLQFTADWFPIRQGKYVALRFKARSSVPFTVESGVNLMMTRSPWSSYGETVAFPGEIGEQWREYRVIFFVRSDAEDGRVTFFLGSVLPDGAEFDFVPLETHELQDVSLGTSVDVGNLVLTERGAYGGARKDSQKKRFVPTYDRREYAGFKRWTPDELKEPNDFCYDRVDKRVFMKCDVNPGEKFASIEAPLRIHACRATGHDITVENIAFTHTAAHGISSVTSKRVVVRDCFFDWIGGGDLSGEGPNGRRVRFGNGVEFWDGSEDCSVERCAFARVYDVAVTTQGPSPVVSKNLVVRDCLMFRCEQALEIWFSDPETVVEGLVFERNLCVDCGREWSHIQRPNKIATPILGYSLEAKKVDVTIRENVFYDTAQFFVKCWHNRILEYHIDDNVYWIDPKKTHESGDKYFCYDASNGKEPMTFDEFRKATGHDAASRWIKPEFKDYAKDDFTLLNRAELKAGPVNVPKVPNN